MNHLIVGDVWLIGHKGGPMRRLTSRSADNCSASNVLAPIHKHQPTRRALSPGDDQHQDRSQRPSMQRKCAVLLIGTAEPTPGPTLPHEFSKIPTAVMNRRRHNSNAGTRKTLIGAVKRTPRAIAGSRERGLFYNFIQCSRARRPK